MLGEAWKGLPVEEREKYSHKAKVIKSLYYIIILHNYIIHKTSLQNVKIYVCTHIVFLYISDATNRGRGANIFIINSIGGLEGGGE